MAAIRVLVVDDSVVIRRLLTSALNEDPAVEVVGTHGPRSRGDDPKIKALVPRGLRPAPAPRQPALVAATNGALPASPRLAARASQEVPVSLVAIGAFTGGPSALSGLLPELCSSFPVPIVIVQHMLPTFTQHFAERLASQCAVQVVEAGKTACEAPARSAKPAATSSFRTRRLPWSGACPASSLARAWPTRCCLVGGGPGDVLPAFAELAARLLFASTGVPSHDDERDALSELTNMIAGNLKTLLPAPSFLALPTVADGIDGIVAIMGSRLVEDVELLANGQRLGVQVLVRAGG